MRSRFVLSVLVAIVAAGALLRWETHGTEYRADVVLPVGTFDPSVTSLDHYQVATQSLAADYARLDAIAGQAADGVDIDVSPVVGSPLVRIRARADTERNAERAATAAAASLIAFSESLTIDVDETVAGRAYRRTTERYAAATIDEQQIRSDSPGRAPLDPLAQAVGTGTAAAVLRDIAYGEARSAFGRDYAAATIRGRPQAITARETSMRPAAAVCIILVAVSVLTLGHSIVLWAKDRRARRQGIDKPLRIVARRQ